MWPAHEDVAMVDPPAGFRQFFLRLGDGVVADIGTEPFDVFIHLGKKRLGFFWSRIDKQRNEFAVIFFVLLNELVIGFFKAYPRIIIGVEPWGGVVKSAGDPSALFIGASAHAQKPYCKGKAEWGK